MDFHTQSEWRSAANNDNPNSAYDARTHIDAADGTVKIVECDSKMSPNGVKRRARDGTILR